MPVTDELGISLGSSLIDSGYGELFEGGGVNRAGNRPQNVPERLTDLVVTYSPLNRSVSFAGNIRYNGDFYTSNANTRKVNSFTTIDAAVTWNTAMGALTLRGRNLTDEFYADWSGYSAGLVFVGAPRSTELSFDIRF